MRVKVKSSLYNMKNVKLNLKDLVAEGLAAGHIFEAQGGLEFVTVVIGPDEIEYFVYRDERGKIVPLTALDVMQRAKTLKWEGNEILAPRYL